MIIQIDTTTNIELSDVLEQCDLATILKETKIAYLDVTDFVSLGLFLNKLSDERLKAVAYGLNDITAKKLIEAFKFYKMID